MTHCLFELRVLSNLTRCRRLYEAPTLHATTFLIASLKGWLDFRNLFCSGSNLAFVFILPLRSLGALEQKFQCLQFFSIFQEWLATGGILPEDCDFDINGDEIKKEVKQGDIKQEVNDEDALEAKPNKLHLDKSIADHQYFKSGMSKRSTSFTFCFQ